MEFDPDAEFGFEILINDEIPAYVTTEEMQELLKKNTEYSEVDNYILGLMDKKLDGQIKPTGFHLFPTLISSHLLDRKSVV